MHGYRVVVAIMVNYSQTKIQMGIENNNIVIVNVLHILHISLYSNLFEKFFDPYYEYSKKIELGT